MSIKHKLKSIADLTRYGEYIGMTTVTTMLGVLTWENPALTSLSKALVLTVMNLLTFAFAFMINDIEDAPDDMHDPVKSRRNPVAARRLTRQQGLISAFIFAVASISVSIWCGVSVFIINFIALTLAFAYSWKTMRLKNWPVVDVISHALFLGTLQYLAVAQALPSSDVLTIMWGALSIFVVSVIGDLHNEIRDYAVDTVAGLRNTVQTLGLHVYARWIPVLQICAYSSVILYFMFHASLASVIVMITVVILMISSLTIIRLTRVSLDFSYHNRETMLLFLGVIMMVMKIVGI